MLKILGFSAACLMTVTPLSLAESTASLPQEENPPPSRPSWVYIGTYSRGVGGGVFVAKLDRASGVISEPALAAQAESPAFLALHPTEPRLYAVEELKEDGKSVGAVSGYEIDEKSGKLKSLGRQVTDGGAFCFISFDRTTRFLAAARFGEGNAVILPLGASGAVQPISCQVQHQGSGPNKVRQEKAHTHSINFSPDNRFALVADLGTDEIRSYRFDDTAGKLLSNESAVVHAPGGSGPRHFVFHPSGQYAYAIGEIDATVIAYVYDADLGTLTQFQVSPLLPDGVPGEQRAAEIAVHPSGKFLYASNRGYDALVVFSLNPQTGRLTFVQREHEGLSHPRNFAVDPSGKWLLCANRDSNTVAVYAIDPNTGRLQSTGERIHVPQPVCVRFYPIN